MSEVREVYIKEFPINKIKDSCTWVVIGSPGRGKSTFIEHLIYMNKHKYPVIKIASGTEMVQGNYGKFTKHLFISGEYRAEEHEKFILRQKLCISEGCKNPNAIFVLDDCSVDRKIFNSVLMKSQFKNGAQWYKNLFIVGSQYIFDLPPDLRKTISYVAIFQENSLDERKKLYTNFAVNCTFPEFCDLMDQLTGDYTCLIFDKRSESNSLEDCAFYCKAKVYKEKWDMGCTEYKTWNKERLNPNYSEMS